MFFGQNLVINLWIQLGVKTLIGMTDRAYKQSFELSAETSPKIGPNRCARDVLLSLSFGGTV